MFYILTSKFYDSASMVNETGTGNLSSLSFSLLK